MPLFQYDLKSVDDTVLVALDLDAEAVVGEQQHLAVRDQLGRPLPHHQPQPRRSRLRPPPIVAVVVVPGPEAPPRRVEERPVPDGRRAGAAVPRRAHLALQDEGLARPERVPRVHRQRDGGRRGRRRRRYGLRDR